MYKPIFKDKKAVLFGLDNCITSLSPFLLSGLKQVQKKHEAQGFSVLELVYDGHSIRDIWEQISEDREIKLDVPVDILVEETNAAIIAALSGQELETVEGLYPFLHELKIERKFKLGLVSNLGQDVVNAVLNLLDLGSVFDLVIAGDKEKMFFNPYKEAVKKLGMHVKDCLVFENTFLAAGLAEEVGLEMIIVGERTNEESAYTGLVYEFAPTYESFIGNTNRDQLEILKKRAEELQQSSNPL